MKKEYQKRDDRDLLGKLVSYFSAKIKNLASLRLVKLVYLTEMAYCLKYNKRMTAIPYFHWNHGPYSKEIEIAASDVDGKLIRIKEKITQLGDEATVYDPLISAEKIELPKDVKDVADEVIKNFGSLTTKEIKEYVYSTSPFKETEKWCLINIDCLYSDYQEDERATFARKKLFQKVIRRGFSPSKVDMC